MPSGGDTIEITFNHPTLGSGRVVPKSGATSTYFLGGAVSEDSDDGIDASGEMIDTMQVKRWSFEIENVAWDMMKTNKRELEIMAQLGGDIDQATLTFTNINNITYMAVGKPVGDIKGNGKDSTISLKFAGGGVMQIIG